MQELDRQHWTTIGGGQPELSLQQPRVPSWQWIDPTDPVQFSNPWATTVERRPDGA